MLLVYLAITFLVVGSGFSEICDFADDLNTCYKKFLSFEALGKIHKQIDGDQNGHVDSSEADKFVRKEFSPAESARMPRSLTSEDPYVSLSDLWGMWRRNPAFNWSVKQTVQWLCDVVDLPQYSEIFIRHSVDGKALPLLAMQNMSYLNDVLMIRNPIDKRKLMLKALDAILFGSNTRPQILPSPLATAAFGIMLLLCIGVSHWYYHTRILCDKNSANSDSPACNERTLKELHSRLEDLEQIHYRLNNCELGTQLGTLLYSQLPRNTSWSEFSRIRGRPRLTRPWTMFSPNESGSPPKSYLERLQARQELDRKLLPEEERHCLPNELDRSETNSALLEQDLSPSTRQFGQSDFESPLSSQLQLWLQLTYALESEQYGRRKGQAEVQLNAARQACHRLHRKRFNVLGPVRLLYSDSLAELEYKLMQAKSELEHLESELQERSHRWTTIESITGLVIRNNPGIEPIRKALSSIQQSDSSSSHAVSPVGPPSTIFELGPPAVFESENTEPLNDGTHRRMTVPEVVDLVLESRGKSFGGSRSKVHSSSKMTTSDSFVRPFANLWRRKAGSRSDTSSMKQQ